jgi:hypothetical protein
MMLDRPTDKALYRNRINHITCLAYENVPYFGYFYQNFVPSDNKRDLKDPNRKTLRNDF